MALKVQCKCGRTHWLGSTSARANCPCGEIVTAPIAAAQTPSSPPVASPPPQVPPKPPADAHPHPEKPEPGPRPSVTDVAAANASYDVTLLEAGPEPAALAEVLHSQLGLDADASKRLVQTPRSKIADELTKREADELSAALACHRPTLEITSKIRVKCGHCGAVFRVKTELAGKRGPCAKCHEEFAISAEAILPPANLNSRVPTPDHRAERPVPPPPPKLPPVPPKAKPPRTPPSWLPPKQDPASIVGSLALSGQGYHFVVAGNGWRRGSRTEEQEANVDLMLQNESAGVLQCSVKPWKLDFDDLCAGVQEVYRKNVRRFALLGKERVSVAGHPAVLLAFEGTMGPGDQPLLRFLSLVVLKDQSSVHTVLASPKAVAETARSHFAAVLATFSFEPLPPDAQAKALKNSGSRVLEQLPEGTELPQAVEMAALLLRGVIVGLVCALPATWVLSGLIPPLDASQTWNFRFVVLFLATSYFGAIAIGMATSRRIQKLRGPGLSGKASTVIGKFLGFFLAMGILGVQETARVFFQLLGLFHRGKIAANRDAFVTLMIAVVIYGGLGAVALLRLAFF